MTVSSIDCHKLETDDFALLADLSRQWEMTFVGLRPDIPLCGSPERSTWRSVVETDDDQLFVVEKIPSRWYGRKRRIAGVLEKLSNSGLQRITPYLRDRKGEFIPLVRHGLWQLCPFVQGVELDRRGYVKDQWRGAAAADFLVRFQGVCDRLPGDADRPAFSIVAYIRNLLETLSQRAPQIAEAYLPFAVHLERSFFLIHDDLPTRFCHGDYHPLNIIWGDRSIRAVIDWEFCGIKPECYDLANLLGCLGMEDPSSLNRPLVKCLVSRIRESGIFAEESWAALPDLVLAIRFAWLSEWMRKDDQPMIRLEADYMQLLLDYRGNLIELCRP